MQLRSYESKQSTLVCTYVSVKYGTSYARECLVSDLVSFVQRLPPTLAESLLSDRSFDTTLNIFRNLVRPTKGDESHLKGKRTS